MGPIAAGALFEHVGVGAPYLLGAALVLVALTLVPAAGADHGGGYGPVRPSLRREARRQGLSGAPESGYGRCYQRVTSLSPVTSHTGSDANRRISMTDFSLPLNEDQLTLQKWIHDFAENVVRPAAEEWDERRSSPGRSCRRPPRSGCTACDFMAQAMLGDPTGLTMPVAMEELFWGDAGIGLSIFGSGLAAAGIAGNGTPEQVMEWVPQCYGTPDEVQLGAFCVSEPDAGSDVSGLRTKAVYDEAKDEWVLNGTKAWITNGGIADVHVVVASVDPSSRVGVRPASSSRRTPGSVDGPEVQEARHPGVAHLRGRARRLPASRAPACSAARRSSTRSWPGLARR